jgi:hypothetical protein
MGKNLNAYLERYGADAAFRARLKTNFDEAISEYDLTAEEKQQIRHHIEHVAPKIEGHASRVFNDILDKYVK